MPFSIPDDSYVIIIGAMKSGTSSLFHMLSQHPSICPAKKKEPEFFSENQWHGIESEHYEQIFDFNPIIHKKCLEASTGYTKFPLEFDVPKRMKENGIDPYFIYSVRNPFDRLESHYNFTQYKVGSKERNIYDILDILFVFPSMYYLQISEFLKWFPDKNRYFIVDFEDISVHPIELANNIFEWMGLEKYDITNLKPRNVTPSKTQIEEKIDRLSIPWNKFLPYTVRWQLRKLIKKYDKPISETLNPAQRNKLKKWLEYDIKRFGKAFDFPVEKWGF